MAQRLTVDEASSVYASAMRNALPAGPGVCTICKTFIDPDFPTCLSCSRQPSILDAVVPITYSEHLGQVHTALRNYKDAWHADVRRHAMVRLAAILWRFLEAHEGCIAAAAGATGFELVASVPSSSPERDERRANFRTMIGWCEPIAGRYRRVLEPTGEVPTGRAYDPRRYTCAESLDGADVLLLDDTWTGGGHAQSAATALRDAGAGRVALAVIGRHVQPNWEVTPGKTSGEHLEELPRTFDWDQCAVHDSP